MKYGQLYAENLNDESYQSQAQSYQDCCLAVQVKAQFINGSDLSYLRDGQTDRPTDRQTDRPTDRQTDRQVQVQ